MSRREDNDLSIYSKTNYESPFQIFLNNSDEKKLIAKKIRKVVESSSIQRVLDVGCGDASLASEIFAHSSINRKKFKYTGIDPSTTSIEAAHINFSKLGVVYNLHLSTFEAFTATHEKYDIILASHLYFLDFERVVDFINKCKKLIKHNGKIIYILRDKSDGILSLRYELERFINDYKPPKTIQSMKRVLKSEGIAARGPILVPSSLELPKKFTHRIKLIEFILNYDQKNIPQELYGILIDHFRSNQMKILMYSGILIIGKHENEQ